MVDATLADAYLAKGKHQEALQLAERIDSPLMRALALFQIAGVLSEASETQASLAEQPETATSDLLEAAAGGTLAALRDAIERGAELDAKRDDAEGATALMWAAFRGEAQMVRTLIEAGADVNTTDNAGQNAIDEARSWGHEHIMAMLLEARTKQQAQWTKDLVDAAVSGTLAELRSAIERGADVDAKRNDAEGATVLMWAAFRGETEMVRVLLDAGADVNLLDNSGQSAIDEARSRGHEHIVEMLQRTERRIPQADSSAAATDIAPLAGVQWRDLPRGHDLHGSAGVEVVDVAPGSAAWNDGLRPGDVIQRVGDRTVTDVNELQEALADVQVAGLSIQRGERRGFIVIQR